MPKRYTRINRVLTPVLAPTIFITCIDTTTQTFSTANTEQPITINTNIESNGILASVNLSEFTFTQDGLYKLIMFPILSKSTGTSMSHFLWVQLSTDGGSTFVDIADSNSETSLFSGSANEISTITFAALYRFNKDDKIRFMNSVTDTNLSIITKTPPAGNGPRIPSVIMSINKVN